MNASTFIAVGAIVAMVGGRTGCQTAPEGGTRPRDPVTAPANEPFVSGSNGCSVSLLVEIAIEPAGGGRGTLTANLKHGFQEVVIPLGYNGIFKTYEPVPVGTGPYDGIFTSSWTADGRTQSASAGENAGNIVRNFKQKRSNWRGVQGNPPEVQQHHIAATWTPNGQGPCQPPIDFSFEVVFAGATPPMPELKLGDFYRGFQRNGFATPAAGGGTRVFHEIPNPQPRNIGGKVCVPIGIYWNKGDDCCGIKPVRAKVIQFARAAIHGPNGRQGKPWTLDVRDSEAGRAPGHDPTYTSDPRSDGDERAQNGGGGGTRSAGSDLTQWDAPGMPQSLYDRLFHAEGPSEYRQQFLSFLVCRPNGADRHKADFYWQNAKVKEIAITTVTWRFAGQRGIDRSNPTNLRRPTVSVSFHREEGLCKALGTILASNGLEEAFRNPSEKARELQILPEGAYTDLLTEVSEWESAPGGKIRTP